MEVKNSYGEMDYDKEAVEASRSTLMSKTVRRENACETWQRIFLYFLQDYRGYSICYFIGHFLICTFYTILAGEMVELIYPFLLSLFVYVVGMGIAFVRYLKLFRGVEQKVQYDDYEENLHGKMETHVMRQMRLLHRNYIRELEERHIEKEKEKKFLSMLIHNIKTPVTVNDLLIQRIENQEIEPLRGITQMKEENVRLLTNLNHTLNILRLEEFQKDYIPEAMDLVEEIRELINKNKRQFIYSRVFPKVEVEQGQAWILSDRKWNELMLEQIISNGIKYSKTEGVAKNLYFHIKQLNNYVELTIKDEGIGIPEYDLKKIFEPFFTGENGRKGYSSSGIGLYFCKEVANCLGHKLELTSTEGVGTQVRITYLAKL